MSYTPTTWATGDTITSEKLNKIETGIEEAHESILEFSDENNDGHVTISFKTPQATLIAFPVGG